MSIDEIRAMIRTESEALLDEALQELKGVIDTRLAGPEARVCHGRDFGSTETY